MTSADAIAGLVSLLILAGAAAAWVVSIKRQQREDDADAAADQAYRDEELALSAVEKLTEPELRALRNVVIRPEMWPGVLSWHANVMRRRAAFEPSHDQLSP